jgi:hypothetical protein
MDNDKDIKDIIGMIVADTIMSILTDNPTTQTTRKVDSTESIAWIEVYDDEIDKAYDMSQEYKEYGKL